MDAKSQLMIKGYQSLTPRQKELIRIFYDNRGELFTYAGMDAEATEVVNDIIREHLQDPDGRGVIDKIKQVAASAFTNQAMTIIRTEIAQAVEASRAMMYKKHNYSEKRWLTVMDSRVRPGHTANQEDGWIGIDANFSNGASSPAEEINCRCTVIYKKNGINESQNQLINMEIGDRAYLIDTQTYNFYKKYSDRLELKDLGKPRGAFDNKTSTVKINPVYTATRRKTFTHEVGHLIDHISKDDGKTLQGYQFSIQNVLLNNTKENIRLYSNMTEAMRANRLSSQNKFLKLFINENELFSIIKRRVTIDDSGFYEATTLSKIKELIDDEVHYNYLISPQEVFAEGYSWYKMLPDTMKDRAPLFYDYYENLNEI